MFKKNIPKSGKNEYLLISIRYVWVCWYNLLKMKNERNSTWVNFKSFHLMKASSTLIVIIVLKLHKNQNPLSEISIWVYWTYNQICGRNNNTYIGQDCSVIEPAPQFSTPGLKQSALTIRPRRHISDPQTKIKEI